MGICTSLSLASYLCPFSPLLGGNVHTHYQEEKCYEDGIFFYHLGCHQWVSGAELAPPGTPEGEWLFCFPLGNLERPTIPHSASGLELPVSLLGQPDMMELIMELMGLAHGLICQGRDRSIQVFWPGSGGPKRAGVRQTETGETEAAL